MSTHAAEPSEPAATSSDPKPEDQARVDRARARTPRRGRRGARWVAWAGSSQGAGRGSLSREVGDPLAGLSCASSRASRRRRVMDGEGAPPERSSEDGAGSTIGRGASPRPVRDGAPHMGGRDTRARAPKAFERYRATGGEAGVSRFPRGLARTSACTTGSSDAGVVPAADDRPRQRRTRLSHGRLGRSRRSGRPGGGSARRANGSGAAAKG